ncbi:hypothetical protein Tco_0267044 [Tanacetum coccineum]
MSASVALSLGKSLSTRYYTSVSEDDSDIGSPGVDGPPIMPEDPYAYIMAAYKVPPSPDYIPGPEVPPSPDYIPGPEVPPSPDYIPGPEGPPSPDYPVYPEYIPPEDDVFLAEEQPLHVATSPTTESPGYIPESDPEEDPKEDPADYPADRDDDDEEEEDEEHPALADSVPPVHWMTARISIRDEPSISLPPREEVERLLALTTPPPSPLTPLSSALPKIPSPTPNSPTHIEIPESCLPLRKRVHFASPTPSREVGESSAAGAARQDRPTIAREDLYGFVNMVDVPPRCSTSRELDYGITDTWDDLVGAIDEIEPTTVEGVNQRVTDLATIVEEETTNMYGIMEDAQDDRSLLRARVNLLYRDRPFHRRLAIMIEREAKMAREAWGLSMDSSDYAPDHKRQRVISELLASDHKRQVQLTKTLRLLKGLQTQRVEFQRQHGPTEGPLQPNAPGEAENGTKRKAHEAMINEGVTATLATRDATRNGNDSHTSGTSVRRPVQVARECTYPDFLKCQPLNFKGTEGVVGLTQWFEKIESVYSIAKYSSNAKSVCTCTMHRRKCYYLVDFHVKTITHEDAHAMPWRHRRR